MVIMSTLLFQVIVVCSITTLTVRALPELKLEEVLSFFNDAEEIMTQPRMLNEAVCDNRTKVFSSLVKNLTAEYRKVKENVMGAPKGSLTKAFFDNFYNLCDIYAERRKDVNSNVYRKCRFKKPGNETHYYGVPYEEMIRRLNMIKTFLKKTGSFIEPLISLGIDAVHKEIEIPPSMQTVCHAALQKDKEDSLSDEVKKLNVKLTMFQNLADYFHNGTILDNEFEEKSTILAHLYPTARVAPLYICKYFDRINDEPRFRYVLCSEGFLYKTDN